MSLQMIMQNAMEAMQPNGGDLYYRVKERADQILVQVADTGRGMSLSTKKSCLDPFFTTKSKGSGLGLAVANLIVRAHQGHVVIDSHLGKGTIIKLQFKSKQEPND